MSIPDEVEFPLFPDRLGSGLCAGIDSRGSPPRRDSTYRSSGFPGAVHERDPDDVGVADTGVRRHAGVGRDRMTPMQRCATLLALGALTLSPLLAPRSVSGADTDHVEVIASGLDRPWAFAFLPDGRPIVAERPGRLRIVGPDRTAGAPIAGVPRVDNGGQGGLLDLVLDSRFDENRTLYFCFSEAGDGGNSTALARARLASGGDRLEDVRVIFRQQPKVRSALHFGCRIVEARDGHLFLTLGERYSRMQDAQRLDNHHGKVVRIAKDGTVPADNPFVGRAGALPEIWSYGHRNPQGATLDADGRLWVTEHGPQGGDELNLVLPGRNFGWPVITFGEQYGGGRIGEGITAKAGMEPPVLHWTPSMAPSGLAFLANDRYGAAWRGNLFAGSLKFQYLERIAFGRGGAPDRERLLEGIGERVRDVRVGPDGLLYLLTEGGRSQLLRVLPEVARR
jgi:glucose/arabinose dehydrogenase